MDKNRHPSTSKPPSTQASSASAKSTEPSPTEPSPTEPSPTEPSPTEPSPTEPSPTEPSPTEPSHKREVRGAGLPRSPTTRPRLAPSFGLPRRTLREADQAMAVWASLMMHSAEMLDNYAAAHRASRETQGDDDAKSKHA
jgi:hypothetical protein